MNLVDELVLWSIVAAAATLSVFWWSTGPDVSATAAAGLWLMAGLIWLADAETGIVVAAGVGALAVTLAFAPRWVRRSRALAGERVESARGNEPPSSPSCPRFRAADAGPDPEPRGRSGRGQGAGAPPGARPPGAPLRGPGRGPRPRSVAGALRCGGGRGGGRHR